MSYPLHHMTDKELVHHADNAPNPTPLERELAERLHKLLDMTQKLRDSATLASQPYSPWGVRR